MMVFGIWMKNKYLIVFKSLIISKVLNTDVYCFLTIYKIRLNRI